jgi:hypothetical protein
MGIRPPIVRQEAEAALQYFTNYCHDNNLAAKSYLAFGTDPIEELTKLAEVIHKEFSDSIFFSSKLISHIRQLVHPTAA